MEKKELNIDIWDIIDIEKLNSFLDYKLSKDDVRPCDMEFDIQGVSKDGIITIIARYNIMGE